MKHILTLFIFIFLTLNTHAADDLKASGAVKVLLGSEGKKIEMLEVNDSKQILVRPKGIGGQWEGKTFLWSLENLGPDTKDIYFEQKKGSKMQRMAPLVQREGQWQLYIPEFPGKAIQFYYSSKDSEKLQAKELIESYSNQKK